MTEFNLVELWTVLICVGMWSKLRQLISMKKRIDALERHMLDGTSSVWTAKPQIPHKRK